jgi:hypothetical protein
MRSDLYVLLHWAHESSFHPAIFESVSLQAMIETSSVDLRPAFEISIIGCDCDLDFPAYSIVTGQRASRYAHIHKFGPQS